MKKLLILMLVFSLSSVASATTVGLYYDPLLPGGSPATAIFLNPSDTFYVYVTVDTTGPGGVADPLNLGNLDAVITVAGPATILSAINLADIPAGTIMGIGYGAEVVEIVPGNFYTYAGGWNMGFNPIPGPGNIEIGMGQFNSQIYDTTLPAMAYQPADPAHGNFPWYQGAVGYVEIHCDGPGIITVSIADGFSFGAAGSMMDDGVTKPAFGVPIPIYQVVPEPATIALLGLGGLALLRRRK